MYYLKYDQPGDLTLEVPFDTLEKACAHALRLRHFYSGVDIVDETGEPVELM